MSHEGFRISVLLGHWNLSLLPVGVWATYATYVGLGHRHSVCISFTRVPLVNRISKPAMKGNSAQFGND